VAAFYGPLFARLPAAAPPGWTRLLAFQSACGDGRVWHRLGIEVAFESPPPAEWTRWDVAAWEWLVHDAEGRPLGGFRAPDGRLFDLTGMAWLLPGAPPAPDAVELVPYDPAWPARYAELAGWLRARLGPDAVTRVEHYGSTAVPGLCAKPVLDVLVETPSWPAARTLILPLCSGREWEYWWYDEHMVLVRRAAPGGLRLWHLHVAPPGHRVFAGLGFRDRLRADPHAAARYARLKQDLAAAHRADRERYTRAKSEFVRGLTPGPGA